MTLVPDAVPIATPVFHLERARTDLGRELDAGWQPRPGMYYDTEGRPCTLGRWAELTESNADRRVAWTRTRHVTISTVWIGINLRFTEVPLIYETMIFGGVYDLERLQTPTLGLARIAHKCAVALVRRPHRVPVPAKVRRYGR